MQKVGVVGSPENQTVTRHILARANTPLAIWHPHGDAPPQEKQSVVALSQLRQTPLIFFNAPLEESRLIARQLGDVITGRHVIVHTIRGVETQTLKTITTILREETPTQRLGFISGPVRSEDLDANQAGSAVCASRFPEVHDMVEGAMNSPLFRLYRSEDLVGAEFSSVYARIIALMSGVADGLHLGASFQATLFARGLAEMARFVVLKRGFERTCFGLAGAGNLYTDTYDAGSIDFQIGVYLANHQGLSASDLTDAFGAPARELLSLLQALGREGENASLELHILQCLRTIIGDQKPAAEIVETLLSQSALYE